MVTSNSSADKSALKLSIEAQSNVLTYSVAVLTAHRRSNELMSKMEAIDRAYARYKAMPDDEDAANKSCNVFAQDNIVAPIVVSQVDSMVSYLADVFLSGSPLFPVVSSPTNKVYAEQLETLLDDHAQLGGYVRQLLMFLRDGVKYNYSAIEADWTSIDQFSVLANFDNNTGKKINRNAKFFTKIKRLDPYNVVRDYDVAPGDISAEGDFAGYLQIMSRLKLKRLLNKFNNAHKAYNIDKAMSSNLNLVGTNSANYRVPPQVSNYITNQGFLHGVDWMAYLTGGSGKRIDNSLNSLNYEVFTLYARILPADFAISAPQKNTPQIWKFVIVNNSYVVYAERIISAYDYLPILFGQPLEDGLSYQTQSVAEGEMPFQEAAATLFNIRFAASRRAVSDRALYRADMISPTDVNNPTAAPKIPVNISSLLNQSLESAYRQIPFDARGTETAIQDAATIVSFSKDLHGINNAQQGQFQKGNKSVKEWDDTMAGSDGRLRLPALCLEYQIFAPLKSILTLNIFQYGEDVQVVSQKTGNVLDINIDLLRKQVLSFKLADGYTPASKMASTDMLTQGIQMIAQSPVLQQAYGASLPAMFAHMMSLGGVKGLELYNPQTQQQPSAAGLPGQLGVNNLQVAAPVPVAPQTTTQQAPSPSTTP